MMTRRISSEIAMFKERKKSSAQVGTGTTSRVMMPNSPRVKIRSLFLNRRLHGVESDVDGIEGVAMQSEFQAAGFEFVEIIAVGAIDVTQNFSDGLIKLSGNRLADLTELEEGTGHRFVFNGGDLEFCADALDALGEGIVAFCQNDRGKVHSAFVF